MSEDPIPSSWARPVVHLSHKASLGRLAEFLSALANAGGGTLLVGAEIGMGDADATLDRVLEATLATDPPLLLPLPRLVEAGRMRAVAVTVPPGLPHVYSYRGRYQVWEGDRSRPLDPRRLRQLIMLRAVAGFEAEVPDGASLADLDEVRVEAYLASRQPRPPGGWEEVLRRRGCLTGSAPAWQPTFAGLLLFGREPQRWVPSSEILVARYSGRSMTDSFLKEEIRGTLPDQIRRAEAFVTSNMRRGVRLQGLERVEETELPLPAVREAIVNAVAHRDYRIRGDEIRILAFADRIEFYSPGRLPGHVTVQNLIDERYSRNEAIVQVLSDMGFIERLGYGIDRMVRLMAEAGLAAPRFEETAAGFQVTLFGRGEELFGAVRDARRWLQLGLNERQEAALAYLADKGRITNREYQELCPDVSAETIRRDLADMVAKSLLLKIGEKRATYYIFK